MPTHRATVFAHNTVPRVTQSRELHPAAKHMKRVKIHPSNIAHWDAFHDEFAKRFDFPNYYGRNMDAWIDCMDECITEPTVLDLGDCRALAKTNPSIITALLDCTAFVNYRRLEAGETPMLLLSMFH